MGAITALSTASAQERLAADSIVQAIVRQRVDEGRSAGIAIGIIDADGVRTFVYGGNRGRLDEHTLFEIGSITKTFTAAILADMVARGLVRFDQPVAEMLPPGTVIPGSSGRQITLLDLATHRSGLPYMPGNFKPRDSRNPYADYDARKLLDFLAKHRLTRDVGAAYEYSNVGMGLLGHALAARAGTTYDQLLRDRILAPLGMRETVVTLTPESRSRLAPGHGPDLKPVKSWDLDALAGAGALRSSLHDMLIYLSANIDAEHSPAGAALAATHGRRAPTAQQYVSVGLGWNRYAFRSDTVVGHGGDTGGYSSVIAFSPRRRVGVVVLSNSMTFVADIAYHLLARTPLTKGPASRREIAVSIAALQRLVGDYDLTPTYRLRISREGDKLFVQGTGQRKERLFAESDSTFFLKVVDTRFDFESDSTGNVTALVVITHGGREYGGRQRAPRRRP